VTRDVIKEALLEDSELDRELISKMEDLEADNERLREALRMIVKRNPPSAHIDTWGTVGIARTALTEQAPEIEGEEP